MVAGPLTDPCRTPQEALAEGVIRQAIWDMQKGPPWRRHEAAMWALSGRRHLWLSLIGDRGAGPHLEAGLVALARLTLARCQGSGGKPLGQKESA